MLSYISKRMLFLNQQSRIDPGIYLLKVFAHFNNCIYSRLDFKAKKQNIVHVLIS